MMPDPNSRLFARLQNPSLGRGLGFRLWGSGGGLGPALSLDFLSSSTLDSRITFTRGSLAMRVDSSGKLTYVPNNLAMQSQSFDNAPWTLLSSTIGADVAVAPDGTATADKLMGNTTNGSHYAQQSITIISGNNYTASVYAKAAEIIWLTLQVQGLATAYFNLSTGVVGTVTNGTASISSVGNGWYRCSVNYTASATSAGFRCYLANADNSASFAGANTTDGLYLWGAQFETVTYQAAPSTYNATTSAAYYGPRFDYDPASVGTAKGLLIEEQRTNLCLQSSTFTNASWSTTNGSVTASAATAPDGTTAATKLQVNTTSGSHIVSQNFTITNATVYTASVFIKAGEYSWAAIQIQGLATAYINLSTGALGTVASGTATVTNYGNGWYRLAVTYTSTATSAGIRIYVANGDNSVSFAGANTTDGIYIWGAQFEQAAFATSHIPTAAAQVTRSAETDTIPTSAWFNPTENTIFIQADSPGSGTRIIWQADDGTANNRITIYTTGTTCQADIITGGVSQASLALGTITANARFKVALAVKTNDFSGSLNGAACVTSGSGTIPTVTIARNGQDTTGNQLCGHEQLVQSTSRRLPNSQLQALTT